MVAELANEVAKLPGALQSLTPELLIDYLATILKLEDAQPRQWCGFIHSCETDAAMHPGLRHHLQLVAPLPDSAAALCSVQEPLLRSDQTIDCWHSRSCSACREPPTCAADGGPHKWDLFERMLAEDPDSAAAQEEAAAMEEAAQRLQARTPSFSCSRRSRSSVFLCWGCLPPVGLVSCWSPASLARKARRAAA